MSENQDIRPEENSASSIPPVPPLPSTAASSAAPGAASSVPPATPAAAPSTPAGAPSTPAAAPTGGVRPQAAPAFPSHPAPADTSSPTLPYPGQGFGIPLTAQSGVTPPAPEKKKSGAGKVVGLLVAAALVGGAAGVGTSWAAPNLWGPTGASSTAAGPQVVTVNNTDSVNATAAIATKVVPSVVTINVTAGQSGGTGSGVVLSKDGYVLTNTHVVTLDGESGSATISVTTSDGHIYQAKIVGTDPVYDLAVIKLEGATDLTPITWGDSSNLNVGDQTVAIGAPLGLSNTVTTGIVSALNRSIEIASSAAPDSGQSDGDNDGEQGDNPFFFDFGQGQGQSQQTTDTIKIAVIQTDAPINPGNSGGALVNNKGELVGINVAIASAGSTSTSEQSGSIGVGFSIPSDIAHRVANDLMKDGKTTHGLLGASVRDASSVEGSTITGAYIVDVTDGGGAAAAGLRAGDIVTKFNDVPVTGAVDLTAQVRALATGSKADVTFVRDGQTKTTEVTLGTLAE
ncbi:PDZ domain-containing protein [Microbacterium protaetiae]|uniref:PDZ domain-containing protein n=1 Tax=Microbacterium protaetiae TaxID=2509458 RepID=A0A4P6EFH9_9MICO|nr:trypsin-like peptidase domain-containing protein [Microbacterium protaetiae]QAY61045.1 PDZ domain-containing protein [Microbacterium protaetiae]